MYRAILLVFAVALLAGCANSNGVDNNKPTRIAVLIHGGGWVSGSPESLGPLAKRFIAEGWVVRNLKYPTWPQASVAEQEEWVAKRLKAIGFENKRKPVVFGSSAGAHLALRNSEHARAVIVDSAPTKLDLPVCEGNVQDSEEPCMLSASAPAFDGKLFGDFNPQKPKAPTLALHGREDQLVPVGFIRSFAEAHPNVDLVVFDQARHGLVNTPDGGITRDELFTIMTRWLNDLDIE